MRVSNNVKITDAVSLGDERPVLLLAKQPTIIGDRWPNYFNDSATCFVTGYDNRCLKDSD